VVRIVPSGNLEKKFNVAEWGIVGTGWRFDPKIQFLRDHSSCRICCKHQLIRGFLNPDPERGLKSWKPAEELNARLDKRRSVGGEDLCDPPTSAAAGKRGLARFSATNHDLERSKLPFATEDSPEFVGPRARTHDSHSALPLSLCSASPGLSPLIMREES
jgi:hypothetical protein